MIVGQITESYPRMPNPYCFIPPLLFHTPEGYDPVIVNGTGVPYDWGMIE